MGTGFILVMKMFWNEIVVLIIQSCDYTKSHRNVHFKRMDFLVCELYLKKRLKKQAMAQPMLSLLLE